MIVLDFKRAELMVSLIRWMNAQGWSPATSTNYSFRNSKEPLTIAISKSGIDKSVFNMEHFMLVDSEANPLEDYKGIKSSAETLLHTVLYQENSEVEFILHTHSVNATILSQYYLEQGFISLEGYEVLKGIGNYSTHEVRMDVPIFENTQDIKMLSEDFRKLYRQQPQLQAYLISGHGLYTWGKSFEDAKRHLEVLEFLLECEYRKLTIKK